MQVTIKFKTARLFKRFKSICKKGNDFKSQKRIEPPDILTLVPQLLKIKVSKSIRSDDREAGFECLKKLINKKLTIAQNNGLEIPVFIPPAAIKIQKERAGIMDNIGNIFTPSYGIPKTYRDNYTGE